MKKYSFLTLLVLTLILCQTGCSQLLSPQPEQPTPQYVLVGAPADATPTPTAFQPMAPTAGPRIPQSSEKTNAIRVVSVRITPLANPFPDDDPALDPNLHQMELFRQPDNQMNIVLLGSDQRPNDNGFRTDVIMLATVNREEKTVNLTSLPRDLYVYQPGVTSDKINTTFQNGGFEVMARMFEYNFGVIPDYYALINFSGFEQLIDTIGGIDVNVAVKLKDHRDKHGQFTVKPGVNHMDGETALWYVRSRKTTSDFDRARRQQEVIQALVKKLLTLDNLTTNAPKIYKQLGETVETNMGLNQMLGLIPTALQFNNPDAFGRYVVDDSMVTEWIDPYGSLVLLPHQEEIREVMRRALNAE